MAYLTATDVVSGAGAVLYPVDSFALQQWNALSSGQQTDLVQWASDQVDVICGRVFADAISRGPGSKTMQLWGTDTDLIFLPEIPLVSLTNVGVFYPGQTQTTALDATKYVVNAWGRTIRAMMPQASWIQWGFPAGWPASLEFLVTYTYGIDFTTAPASGSDSRKVQLYNDIRRATLMFAIRRLHLMRSPSNVQRMKRGDSEEVQFAQSQDVRLDGTTVPVTPLEADIRAILRPWIYRGDPR